MKNKKAIKNLIMGIKKQIKPKEKPKFDFFFSGSPVTEVTEALRSVDTESPEAKLNATTISDGNGGRIELNQDDQKVIKK